MSCYSPSLIRCCLGAHFAVLVPRRSLLIMTGEARYVWTHGLLSLLCIQQCSIVADNSAARNSRAEAR
jgi:hypothetical protein